ncbi:MAG: response regulator transcription factor [Bacteroidota bacterium]
MQGIRVLLVDDHQIVIDGIKALLRKADHIEIVAEALNGQEALLVLERQTIDLMICDIQMPVMDGLALCKLSKDQHPATRILVLSMNREPQMVNDIFMTGAEGFVLKNTGKKELIKAIDQVVQGGTFYSREILQILMEKHRSPTQFQAVTAKLSPREYEILLLIAEEHATPAIAQLLHISPRTVETHRKHLLEKTASKSVVGLIRYAFQHQLI